MQQIQKLEERIQEYEKKISHYEKVNKVLMNRVERSIDSTGSAFSLFESNILLQNTINERTQELARANKQLQQELSKKIQAEKALKESNDDLQNEISERKKVEEKLRLFTTKLEQSNRELQEFASVASHDLQEPLRKVRAFGDRLKTVCGEELSEKGLNYLERMQSAAGRMQILIEDLLTFSRVTSKGKPFVTVDLRKIAEEVLSDMEVAIEQLNGSVELGELPVIEADPLQMRQLLQNLISNGLKFHKKDEPPFVKVYGKVIKEQDRGLSGTSSDQEFYQLIVKDNGIGFDEKYRDKVFTIFQRLHSRDEYEGTGIGLAVCRKIAERHGGTITANSTLGKGAEFHVILHTKHSRTRCSSSRNDMSRQSDVYGKKRTNSSLYL